MGFDLSCPNHTVSGRGNQPLSVGQKAHSGCVTRIDPRAVLWENVHALMKHHWGKENLTRLSREAKIGPVSASRIKAAQTSVGLDVVDAVAAVFELELWQLLIPGLDPKNPPATQPLTETERQLYGRLMTAFRQISLTP